MTRQLRPCGTRSAYKRHLYNNETPCADCRAANSAGSGSVAASLKVGEREMDEALAKNPPVIQWVFDQRRRVMVAASIYDPHTDRPGSRLRQQRQLEFYEQKRAAS